MRVFFFPLTNIKSASLGRTFDFTARAGLFKAGGKLGYKFRIRNVLHREWVKSENTLWCDGGGN